MPRTSIGLELRAELFGLGSVNCDARGQREASGLLGIGELARRMEVGAGEEVPCLRDDYVVEGGISLAEAGEADFYYHRGW